jgi:hypothetical protein
LQNDFKKDAPKFTPSSDLQGGSSQPAPAVIPKLGIKIWYSNSSEYTDVYQIIDAFGDDLTQ